MLLKQAKTEPTNLNGTLTVGKFIFDELPFAPSANFPQGLNDLA
jgi:hypothetical protein